MIAATYFTVTLGSLLMSNEYNSYHKMSWNGLDPTVEQYFLLLSINAASGYSFIVFMSLSVYFHFPDAVLLTRKQNRGKVILQILSSLLQTSHNETKSILYGMWIWKFDLSIVKSGV